MLGSDVLLYAFVHLVHLRPQACLFSIASAAEAAGARAIFIEVFLKRNLFAFTKMMHVVKFHLKVEIHHERSPHGGNQ